MFPTVHDREYTMIWTEVERELASNAVVVVVNMIEEVASMIYKFVFLF
jgi:hypothetical protein